MTHGSLPRASTTSTSSPILEKYQVKLYQQQNSSSSSNTNNKSPAPVPRSVPAPAPRPLSDPALRPTSRPIRGITPIPPSTSVCARSRSSETSALHSTRLVKSGGNVDKVTQRLHAGSFFVWLHFFTYSKLVSLRTSDAFMHGSTAVMFLLLPFQIPAKYTSALVTLSSSSSSSPPSSY